MFGFIPVGGIILPLIPLGFGIGLTFPVFLLAAQNQVEMVDVGEAGGLIQFLQSLGGAVGLSVLASFQATRFASLDPSPSAACSSATPPMPLCASYLGSLRELADQLLRPDLRRHGGAARGGVRLRAVPEGAPPEDSSQKGPSTEGGSQAAAPSPEATVNPVA